MRPVKARRGRAPQTSGRAGRKAPVRTSERSGRRVARPVYERGGALSRLAAWWHGSFAARRPVLSAAMALALVSAGTALFAGEAVSRFMTTLGTAYSAAFGRAGFTVTAITVKGNERTPAGVIYAAAGVEPGQSIYDVDPAQARLRLLQLPWVADAEVRRRFPDSVTVTLIEKRPFALWKTGDVLSVVERSGAVITRDGVEGFAQLPLLLGPGAPEAAAPIVDALGGERAISARLKGLQRVSQRRWDLILDGGVIVRLPETGWENQLAELERLIVDRGVLERDIEIIDLRYPDRYIFQLHNGDSQPVSRERPA